MAQACCGKICSRQIVCKFKGRLNGLGRSWRIMVTQRRRRTVLTVLGLYIFAALFIGYFAWYAIDLVLTSWRINDMSTGVLIVPLWIPQLGFTTGLVILWIAMVDELVHVARGNRPRYEKDPPRSAEEAIERAASSGV